MRNVKKGVLAAVIVAVIVLIVCFAANHSSSSEKIENESNNDVIDTEVEYVPAVVDKNTVMGVDGTRIACGNKEYIVFYDYYGLFVYDGINRELLTSLDLESIGCSYTQGDEACKIFMDAEDNILIHAMNSDIMYEFDYKNNSVVSMQYDETRCVEDTNFVDLSDYIEPDNTIFQSQSAYKFKNNGIINLVWLESSSGLPIDMTIQFKDKLLDKSNQGTWEFIFKNIDTYSIYGIPEASKKIYAQGTFDNVMGYSGYYIYYNDIFPIGGYYYTDDGTQIATVWGVEPEDVGYVDLNGDGKNELISSVVYGDGGMDVIVFSEFEDGIRYAQVTESFDEEYDNVSYSSLLAQYLKETNEVEYQYWIESEQQYKTKIMPIEFDSLTWWDTEWSEFQQIDSMEISDESSEEMTEEKFESWQSAYLDIIYNLTDYLVPQNNDRTYENPMDKYVYLGLHDFDDDGIMELMAGDTGNMSVFTYKDGHVERIADLYDPRNGNEWGFDGVFFKDNSLSLDTDGSGGSNFVNFGYFDGEYLLGFYNELSVDNVPMINGKECSREEVDRIYTLDYDKRSKEENKERIRLVNENGTWILRYLSGEEVVLDSNFDFDLLLW